MRAPLAGKARSDDRGFSNGIRNQLSLTIDYSPPNWNQYINLERSNRYAASSLKKREKEIVITQCHGKRYLGGYPCEIAIYPHFKAKRSDLDNVRVKGIIDGLVAAGVIENDNLTKVQRLEFIPVFDDQEIIEIKIKEI